MKERHYRVLWRTDDNRTGVLFPGPLTHHEACVCLSKITKYPWRMVFLEELSPKGQE